MDNQKTDLISIGIERIWTNRREWQDDRDDGLKRWKERLYQAKRVSIVSNTFWNNWLDDTGFRKKFFERIKQGNVYVRLVIYDPVSDVLLLRARDEGEKREPLMSDKYQMQVEIGLSLNELIKGKEKKEIKEVSFKLTEQSLENLKNEGIPNETLEDLKNQKFIGRENKFLDAIKNEIGRELRDREQELILEHAEKKGIEIRLADTYPLYTQLIWIDDHMLVVNYLSGRSGGFSPTMQLCEPNSSYFKKYKGQFDIVWESAKPFDFDALQKLVKRLFEGIPSDSPQKRVLRMKIARLHIKITTRKEQWKLLQEKLSRLEEQRILAVDPAQQLLLEKQIAETTANFEQVDQELNDLEDQLGDLEDQLEEL